MGIALVITILGIAFFICIVNMIYRKIEYKNYSTWKKKNAFNSPAAWGAYAFCIAIIIGGIFIYSLSTIITGISDVGKQQNSVTEQQNISSQEQEDTSTQQ